MHEQLPPFPGFQPAAFDFLKQLVLNNEREWFKARKATYDDEIVWPMQCLLAEAAREAGARGFTLTADPKKSIFRIYRDTRFSKNKAPYKTAAGAVLTRNGTNKSFGGVYIHLEPDQCFLAAGFWHPDNDKLRAWRSYMANHQHDFMSMVDKLAESKLELESDEALKRMPRGFEDYAGTDVESYLKWKSFTTSRKFKDKAYQNASFIDEVMRFMEEVYPFLLFGWDTE
ncbi:MAG: DUF2461 domain-containing protein [Rhodothermales bacterium]